MTIHLMRRAGILVALMLGLLAIVASPVAAQESTPTDSTPVVEQPVIVGSTEITWTGDWEYDAATATDEQATFTQIDIENMVLQLLSYGVIEDVSIEDAEQVIDTTVASLRETVESVEENGSGQLDDGTVWRIYTFELQGLQVSLLLTVDQGDDGAFMVTSLIANTSALADAISQVQEDFILNEDGQFFEGLDAAEITEGLPVQATPEASPEATPAT